MAESSNIKSQMRKGMLEYLILLMLQDRRAYPSDIIESMKSFDMIVVEGTIYTLLNRLRKEEKLTYEWEESTQGPPRKYYSLTAKGREVLSQMSEAWDEIANIINHYRNQNQNEQDI